MNKSVVFKDNIDKKYIMNSHLLKCDLFAYLAEIDDEIIELDNVHKTAFKMVYYDQYDKLDRFIKNCIEIYSDTKFQLNKDAINKVESIYLSFGYFGSQKSIDIIVEKACVNLNMMRAIILKRQNNKAFKYGHYKSIGYKLYSDIYIDPFDKPIFSFDEKWKLHTLNNLDWF